MQVGAAPKLPAASAAPGAPTRPEHQMPAPGQGGVPQQKPALTGLAKIRAAAQKPSAHTDRTGISDTKAAPRLAMSEEEGLKDKKATEMK